RPAMAPPHPGNACRKMSHISEQTSSRMREATGSNPRSGSLEVSHCRSDLMSAAGAAAVADLAQRPVETPLLLVVKRIVELLQPGTMPDITDRYRRAVGYVDRIPRARSQTTCGHAANQDQDWRST